MAKIEQRVKRVEWLLDPKCGPSSKPTQNNVFIFPDDQKRYQAFLRYAKKHPLERDWLAIILPAKKEMS